MTIYFHAGQAQLRAAGTGYLLGQAQAQAFRNGYFDQTAQLWEESGELLATTHQVVYYKE
jgi:acyl-CoA thioesterase